MDKTILVAEDIRDGRKLVEALGGIGFPVPSALWNHSEEDMQWRLVLASPLKDQMGSIQIYSLIQSVIESVALEGSLSLDNIMVVSPSHDSVRKLLSALRGTPLMHELNTGDNYIYRLEGSRKTALSKFNARSNAARYRDTIQERIDRLRQFLSSLPDNHPQAASVKQQISFLEERKSEFDALSR